jgi:hypothetical protein
MLLTGLRQYLRANPPEGIGRCCCEISRDEYGLQSYQSCEPSQLAEPSSVDRELGRLAALVAVAAEASSGVPHTPSHMHPQTFLLTDQMSLCNVQMQASKAT